MPGFVLLITDQPSFQHVIEQHLRGIRLATRTPEQLSHDDWQQASLVLIDAQTAPILRSRPHPLPRRDGITLLADPEDADEPDLYQHALALHAAHVVTVPDGAGMLRSQILALAASPPLVVAVLDPDPSGELGTATVAGLAMADTATTEHLSLINAHPHAPGLHQPLRRVDRTGPAGREWHVHELAPGDGRPPPGDLVRRAMTELAEQHAVTLVHLDPQQPDTAALLHGTDLVIVPVRAGSATTLTTRHVVDTASSAAPHVHVHVVGHELNADMSNAVAAGIGAGYPSMTGATLADTASERPHADIQITTARDHRRLWDMLAKYRPRAIRTHSPLR